LNRKILIEICRQRCSKQSVSAAASSVIDSCIVYIVYWNSYLYCTIPMATMTWMSSLSTSSCGCVTLSTSSCGWGCRGVPVCVCLCVCARTLLLSRWDSVVRSTESSHVATARYRIGEELCAGARACVRACVRERVRVCHLARRLTVRAPENQP
jgi:hypothetical protein